VSPRDRQVAPSTHFLMCAGTGSDRPDKVK